MEGGYGCMATGAGPRCEEQFGSADNGNRGMGGMCGIEAIGADRRPSKACMDSFDAYWCRQVARNPQLGAVRVRITTVSLRGFVQHAHRNGYRSDPFEAFWVGILAKSPALRTARVEISTVSIRSIAAHAFGQTSGTNDSPAAKEVGALFERLFGMATNLTGKRKKKSDEY